jgi:hypothetical protein
MAIGNGNIKRKFGVLLIASTAVALSTSGMTATARVDQIRGDQFRGHEYRGARRIWPGGAHRRDLDHDHRQQIAVPKLC